MAASSTSTRAKLEAKRTRIESERQRNIDLVVKQIIGEDDARERIAELKAQRLQVETELAALEEAPSIITLHPATLDQYIETVDALAAVLADHAGAEDAWSTASLFILMVPGKALRLRFKVNLPPS